MSERPEKWIAESDRQYTLVKCDGCDNGFPIRYLGSYYANESQEMLLCHDCYGRFVGIERTDHPTMPVAGALLHGEHSNGKRWTQ